MGRTHDSDDEEQTANHSEVATNMRVQIKCADCDITAWVRQDEIEIGCLACPYCSDVNGWSEKQAQRLSSDNNSDEGSELWPPVKTAGLKDGEVEAMRTAKMNMSRWRTITGEFNRPEQDVPEDPIWMSGRECEQVRRSWRLSESAAEDAGETQ